MRATILFFLLFVSAFGYAQEFPKYLHFSTENGLDQSTVWAIEEDFSHRIWIGSPGGIKVYDGFELVGIPNITGIVLYLQKHDSSIYCVTDGALYKFNPLDFSYQKAAFPSSYYYNPIFTEDGIDLFDYDGKLLFSYDYSLIPKSIKGSQKKIDLYKLFDSELSGVQITGGANGTFLKNDIPITKEYCKQYVRYSKNRAFIASHKGIFEITVRNKKLEVKNYFKDWRIEYLFIDYNQNLWVGTADFGVFMIHRNALQSQFFPKYLDKETPISCWTLFEIDHQIYTATPKGIIPVENENWKDDDIYKTTKSLACNAGIDAGDFILIGTRNDGIYRLQNGTIKQVYYNPEFLLDNTIIQFRKNNKGFLVSSKYALIQLDHSGNYISKRTCDYDKMGSYIMDFCPKPNGYLAARTSGIVDLDSNLKVLKKYSNPKIQVISMLREYQDNWWGVTMDAGLFKLMDDSLVHVPFIDNHLFTLTNWYDTNLWISGVTGIYQYSEKYTRPYSYLNGFPMKEYNQSSFYRNNSDFLYYSGVKGVLKFHPDSVKYYPNLPSVFIERNGKRLDSSKTITLNFDQSELNLEIHPVILSDPNLFKIEVVLDSQTVKISEPTQTNFKIPFGTSSIKIIVTDLVYGKSKIIQYPIFRAIPFWKKPWFIMLSVITIILLIIGLISFIGFIKTRKKLKAEKAENQIKEERLRISKELHDNIGARLTHIISSLDVEMYRNKNDNKSIETINSFARDTMLQLRETIWAVSDKAIFFSEFTTRIEQYVDQINELTSSNILFRKRVKSDFELNPVQTINYYRIVQEAINNSVKYSEADAIKVSITQNRNEITIEISDNGKGFDTQNTRMGTGIKGMKTRVKEVKGSIKISSSTKTGTTIIVKFESE